jgi:hypothetical protein
MKEGYRLETVPVTPKEKKKEQHDEITQQIAYYLHKGGAIKKLDIQERKDNGKDTGPEQDHHKRRF